MWQLQKHLAHLQLDSISAKVDLHQPDLGLHDLCLQGNSLPQAALLKVQLPCGPDEQGEAIVESYIRGSDLVVHYAESKERPLEPTIYWRAVTAGSAIGAELVVSLQTDLLDSEASIVCISEIPATEALRLVDRDSQHFEAIDLADQVYTTELGDATGVFLFRLTNQSYSYAEMVHPSDFEGTALTLDESDEHLVIASNVLFHGTHLEKGVIRRGRVQGIFVPRENDEAAVLAHYQQFAASAPPLTA